ncbi:MAG: hypothetical protein V1799_07675 [bacterium]
MTTEHVALAIMHKSTPEQEQLGQVGKRSGRKFESVESISDRRTAKMALLEKILPKTLGSFKVAGIAEVKEHKKSSHIYIKLIDLEGKEPVKRIVETPENSAIYDGGLTKIEQEHGLTKGTPKIVLCLRSTYWSKPGQKMTAKKTEQVDAKKTENVEKPDAKKSQKKEGVTPSPVTTPATVKK